MCGTRSCSLVRVMCVLSIAATGCSDSDGYGPEPEVFGVVNVGSGDWVIGEAPLASAIVGSEGGRLEGEGVALDIPAGAVPDGTLISIRESELVLDEEYELLSPLFQLEPAGLELAAPVTITLDVPDGASGVVLWSTRDGLGFELAGFVEDGVAQGVSSHFSEVGAARQRGACGSDDGCGDGCRYDELPPEPDDGDGEGGVPADDGPMCDEYVDEPCDRLCFCEADDVPTENLCAQNPGHPDSYCPDVNDQIGDVVLNRAFTRPALGREVRANRNGEACVGWGVRSIDSVVCECIGTATALSNTPTETSLCRRAWTNLAAGSGGQSWACVTDIEGRLPNVLREGRQLFFDLATVAYRPPRGLPGRCTGHWLDQRQEQATDGGEIVGSPRNCSTTSIPVGREYRDLPGTTRSCSSFSWPDEDAAEMFASGDAERVGCGELNDEQWARLREARQFLDMPPRSHRDGNGTAAVLRADGREYTGYNGGAYRAAGLASETNDFCGPGSYTPSHAEGDALNELATAREIVPVVSRLANGGRCPAQEQGYYPDKEIGQCPDGHQGSGELFVDRDPCVGNCAAFGIDRMRRAACLEELIVSSPGGHVRFADDVVDTQGVHAEHGQALIP